MLAARLKSWLFPLLFAAGVVLSCIAVADLFGYALFSGTLGRMLY